MSGLVDAKTGLPVEVADPSDAQQRLLTGDLELRTDQAQTLLDPRTGQLVDADAGNVPKLLEAGYSLATDQQIAKDDERFKYGEGVGNQLAAGAEGALSGATLGLSDIAAKSILPEYATDLAKRREYNPISAGVGEAAGVLGSMYLTGGLSGTVSAPARAVTQGSQLLAEGLTGAMGATSVLGKAGASALGYGVAGALEGGLYGAAKTVSDDYLRDHEITAERIMAGAGNGAIWGGALGAGMGAGSSLLGSGMQKLSDIFQASEADRIAARQVDDAIKSEMSAAGQADAAASAEADAQISQMTGSRSETQIVAELNAAPTSSEQQKAYDLLKSMGKEAGAADSVDDLIQKKILEHTEKTNNLFKVNDDINAHANVSLKPETFTPLFEKAPPPNMQAVSDETYNMLMGLRKKYSDASKAVGTYEKSGIQAAKSAVEDIDQILATMPRNKRVTPRMEPGAAGEMLPVRSSIGEDLPGIATPKNAEELTQIYIPVDRLKRRFGRLQSMAGSGRSGDNGMAMMLREDYDKVLRPHLENEALWGAGAPQAQKAINATITQYLRSKQAFNSAFMANNTLDASANDGFVALQEMDPAKYGSMLSQAGKAQNSLRERTFAVGLERQADMLDSLAKWYNVPDDLKAAVANARANTRAMINDVREIRALNEMAEAYNKQLGALERIPVIGKPLANLKVTVGNAVNTLTKTDARAAARAAAESGADIHNQTAVRIATQGEKASENAASGIISWLRDSAVSAAKRTGKAVKTTAETIAKAGPLMGVALDFKNPASYESAVKNIGALRDPNSDERKIIRARTYGLRQQNPNLADALEAHTQRVADFLAGKAGELSASPKPGDPFGDKRKPRHDPGKAANLARYIDAAQNPGNALKRIGQGEIRREDIETLQTLYPRIYQQVVERVMDQLGNVDEMPKYEARLKLGNLLNAPTDPSLQPERMAALQQVATSGAGVHAQQQAEAPGEPVLSPSQRREPKLAGMYATGPQRIQNRYLNNQ